MYYPIVIVCSYILAILEIMIRKHLNHLGYEFRPYPYLTYLFVGVFFIYMGIFQWYKYRLWIYPVLGIILGILCFQVPALFPHTNSVFKFTYFISFFILVLFIIINWQAFYGQERFEINSRRLFKLAAELISETSDGYTGRPYSAGKVTFTRDELDGFTRFLNGRYVAKSFHFEDRKILAFSLNKSLVNLADPKEVSRVSIDLDGNMSVVISEKDYKEYIARFSFDQLCSSMAIIFERFLKYYRDGHENRIITELKNAR